MNICASNQRECAERKSPRGPAEMQKFFFLFMMASKHAPGKHTRIDIYVCEQHFWYARASFIFIGVRPKAEALAADRFFLSVFAGAQSTAPLVINQHM